MDDTTPAPTLFIITPHYGVNKITHMDHITPLVLSVILIDVSPRVVTDFLLVSDDFTTAPVFPHLIDFRSSKRLPWMMGP